MKNKNNMAKKSKKVALPILFFISMMIVFLPFIHYAYAYPPLPTEIYGIARYYNSYILPGTIISVYDSENNICGSFRAVNTSWNASYFGVLTCRGEDEYAAGPTEGEVLSFRIGNAPASAVVNTAGNNSELFNYSQVSVTWESGTFKEVIIVAPPLICGDSYCDSFESCKVCVDDCGECPTGGGNTSSNTSSNTSTGGTGGAGGGAPGESTAGEAGGADEGEALEEEEEELFCEEDWMCGDWQECLPINMQFRDCIDLNDCGTSESMPEINQFCEYKGDSKVINETYGNKSSSGPRVESPALISVCKEKLPLFSIPSLVFIVLIILIILIAELDYRKRLKKIEGDSSLDELKKLELRYFEKRKKIIFFVVIFILGVIVYLYHYFFFICRDKYVFYLWLLASGILMTPVIVHLLIELSIFSDSEKNKRVSVLNDIHYRHFELLLEIADKELVVAEKGIVDRLYELEQKKEFNKLILGDKIIKKIYDDMNKLFNLYKTLKNPMFVEKDLLESIRKLDEDEEFVNASKQYPELMAIKSNLSLLYAAYEYKQTIYDELANIEKEYGVNEPLVR